MAAKPESTPASGTAWSWYRAREAAVVLAAGVAGFGILIGGFTYAIQPVREDMRIMQATMAEVRERLVRVEERQTGLEEGQVRLEEGQVRLKEDVGRILVLLARRSEG